MYIEMKEVNYSVSGVFVLLLAPAYALGYLCAVLRLGFIVGFNSINDKAVETEKN